MDGFGSRTGTAPDESAFTVLVERHRRELHVHCYRMLGSFDEAEDLVQEVFLRAWRRRDGFEGRSSLRTWLYRIATNACLDRLKSVSRHPVVRAAGGEPSLDEMPWLTPYPDRLLDEMAPPESQPDALVVAKETIELAFLAAIQLLPPRQRAVLILREVLHYSAAESADLLDVTVPAVNSALQRAKATLGHNQPAKRPERMAAGDASAGELDLLRRYMQAHEELNAGAIVDVLLEDARMSISPAVGHWNGRTTIASALEKGMGSLGVWRCVPTWANRQPAIGGYLLRPGDDTYRAFALTVLRVEDGEIAEIRAFERADLFPAFGLPPTI
jgi:RNA polymerase sigma-70 factor, ECF subfamily